MINKIISWYLKKKDKQIITTKEFEHVLNYRATRGELKKTIDEYNSLLEKHVKKMSIKDIKDILKNQHEVIIDSSLKREELETTLYDMLKKEFKKN